MNTIQLQQAFITLSVIVLFSGASISANANQSLDFSANEVEKITEIVKIPDLNIRKNKIKDELNKNNTPKYKDFISTKIATETQRELKTTTNNINKY